MALTHHVSVRNAIADLVVGTLDESDTPGNLVFLTGLGVVVATLVLSQPAFSDSINGSSTSNSIAREEDSPGGVIAKFELRDGDGNPKILGSVTATDGGGDITLSSVSIDQHQTVEVSSMTYIVPL